MFEEHRPNLIRIYLRVAGLCISLAVFGTVATAQDTGGALIGGAGIFRPKNPAAVINTKTVFVGDQVSNARVVAITTDSVTVEFNGNRKVLTLY